MTATSGPARSPPFNCWRHTPSTRHRVIRPAAAASCWPVGWASSASTADGSSRRWPSAGLEAEAYVGLGLARATALPVSSPALNPLDDFQPRSRQMLAGAALGWTGRSADVRLDYQREVDRESRKFGSERAAISGEVRPLQRWSLTGRRGVRPGQHLVRERRRGPALHRALDHGRRRARQYRPHFDLWTIWGAFSPVPYHAVNASVWVRPLRGLELRGRWEHYAFSPTETETPLVDVDDDGWRLGAGASFSPTAGLDHRCRDTERSTVRAPRPMASRAPSRPCQSLRSHSTAYGSTLDRPLEFRFEEAGGRVRSRCRVEPDRPAAARGRVGRTTPKTGAVPMPRVRLGPDPASTRA